MSPSGAHGLNTGLHDAVNLGWKLAGVLRGQYRPGLLDTYDPERRSAVCAFSDFSTRLATIGLYTKRRQILVRDAAYRLGSLTGLLERHMSPRLAQLDSHYGPGKGRLGAGARVPVGWTPTPVAATLAVDSRGRGTPAGPAWSDEIFGGVVQGPGKPPGAAQHPVRADRRGKRRMGRLSGQASQHILAARPASEHPGRAGGTAGRRVIEEGLDIGRGGAAAVGDGVAVTDRGSKPAVG